VSNEFIAGTIFGIIIGPVITMFIFTETTVTQKSVIQHSCAEYNSTTGKFQWTVNDTEPE
jgi:hypothetical protein